MKRILYAFRFLTILPLPWKEGEDMEDVARSAAFFPFVGLVIGLILWGLIHILSIWFSPWVSAIMVLISWVILTGGLHLDGLTDLFDSFGGQTIEDRLRIMKDSSIGSFGAITLVLLLLSKVILLQEYISSGDYSTLILVPMWARVFQLLSIRFFPSARPGGMGDFFKTSLRERDWIIPLLFVLPLTWYVGGFSYLILLVPILIVILLFVLWINRLLGGLTGDCYGAICELTETLGLLI